jgi:hypothetical protein
LSGNLPDRLWGDVMNYSEKLKNPKWQRRRLEILEDRDWTCERCRSKEKTLNVHHSVYHKGFDPWEYSNDDLIVLCEDCHKTIHTLLQTVQKTICECAYYTQDIDNFDFHEMIVSILEDRVIYNFVKSQALCIPCEKIWLDEMKSRVLDLEEHNTEITQIMRQSYGEE